MAADPTDPLTRQEGESDASFLARAGEILEGAAEAGTTAIEVLKLVSQNISSVETAGNVALRAFETQVLKAADLALEGYKKAFTRLEDVSQATVQVQSMLQSVTGLNAISLASTEYGVDTVAKKLSDSA